MKAVGKTRTSSIFDKIDVVLTGRNSFNTSGEYVAIKIFLEIFAFAISYT